MAESEFDLTGSRVLVVDDDPANLDLLEQALEGEGYDVLVAVNGEKGLELAKQSQPDLILLDVMMPGINGYETCRSLKADEGTRSIPVIFLTSLNEPDAVIEGFRAGGVDYVHKPFQKKEVLVRVRTHLERSWLIRTLEKESKALADLNAQLEDKVEKRTYDLHVKMTELESKDRITQRLLTRHTLPETLDLVLEGISHVIDVNQTVIYLLTGQDLQPVSAFGIPRVRGISQEEALDRFEPSRTCRDAIEGVREGLKVLQLPVDEEKTGLFCVLVPILRGDELLGIIEIRCSHRLEEDAVYALEGFALQAAVAISDSQISEDGVLWKKHLKDAFGQKEG